MFKMMTRTALVALAASACASGAVAQAAPNGETLFRQRCGVCHTVQPGVNRNGPSLHGIVGQRAGTVEGYRNYSPALIAWGQNWTPENLERYLAGTRATVPGTRMSIVPPAPAERAAIIRYLEGQR